MDDASAGAVSRAPELEDLVALCRSLNREGVRYLLIGGFAVILHGFVRTTKDIDLLIDPSDANVAAVKRDIGGVRVPVAGKRLLIRLKDTVRPSDHVDVGFLTLRLEAGD